MASVVMILIILYSDSSVVKEIEFGSMSACLSTEKVIEEHYAPLVRKHVAGAFCVEKR